MGKALDFIFLCLASGTIFYLMFLFLLQLMSPNYMLLLWEPEPAILFLEIVMSFVAGAFCVVKAIVELKKEV